MKKRRCKRIIWMLCFMFEIEKKKMLAIPLQIARFLSFSFPRHTIFSCRLRSVNCLGEKKSKQLQMDTAFFPLSCCVQAATEKGKLNEYTLWTTKAFSKWYSFNQNQLLTKLMCTHLDNSLCTICGTWRLNSFFLLALAAQEFANVEAERNKRFLRDWKKNITAMLETEFSSSCSGQKRWHGTAWNNIYNTSAVD